MLRTSLRGCQRRWQRQQKYLYTSPWKRQHRLKNSQEKKLAPWIWLDGLNLKYFSQTCFIMTAKPLEEWSQSHQFNLNIFISGRFVKQILTTLSKHTPASLLPGTHSTGAVWGIMAMVPVDNSNTRPLGWEAGTLTTQSLLHSMSLWQD